MCSRIRFIQSGSFRRNTCFASPSPCQKHPCLALPLCAGLLTAHFTSTAGLPLCQRTVRTICISEPDVKQHRIVGWASRPPPFPHPLIPWSVTRVPSSDGIPQSCGTCRGVSAVPRRSSPKLSARPFPPFPPVAAGADRGSFILPNLRSYALSPGLAGSRL